MIKNILKITFLSILLVISLRISTSVVNDYLIEVEAREKTLADLVIRQQMQEELEEAQAKIDEAIEKEDIVIHTEDVTIKPPVVEETQEVEDVLDTDVVVDTETTTNSAITSDGATDNDSQEATEGSENLDDQNPLVDEALSMIEGVDGLDQISDDTITEVTRFLIENYFLDGYYYAEIETDPVLKQRKELARDMEEYAILSLYDALGLLDVLETFDITKVEEIATTIDSLHLEFLDKFSEVAVNGEEFATIYNIVDEYFITLSSAMQEVHTIVADINESSNPFLALTFALSSIEEDLMPKFTEILNKAFDLKDITNVIFLEGTGESVPLTKEDILVIIEELQSSIFSTQAE